MKRLLNAISFALLCTIPFSLLVALGAAIGIALAPLVHGSFLHLGMVLGGICFLAIVAIYYKMNP